MRIFRVKRYAPELREESVQADGIDFGAGVLEFTSFTGPPDAQGTRLVRILAFPVALLVEVREEL